MPTGAEASTVSSSPSSSPERAELRSASGPECPPFPSCAFRRWSSAWDRVVVAYGMSWWAKYVRERVEALPISRETPVPADVALGTRYKRDKNGSAEHALGGAYELDSVEQCACGVAAGFGAGAVVQSVGRLAGGVCFEDGP